MPDILKVTTPLQPQQGSGRIAPENPQQAQQQVQTVVDPTRVTGTNAQNVYSEREAGKFLPNYESNYEMFLQLLSLSPDAMEELQTLVFSKMGQLVSSGIEQGMAEEIASFMEMMQMDEGQLLQFVKKQLGGSVKFSGPLFEIIRQALGDSRSPELQKAVVNFLKSYDSLSSTEHILHELLSNLESMVAQMPQSRGQQLAELAQQLVPEHPNGENAQNLTFIKENILPFLSHYMSILHDFGPVRDYITMFVLNLARYEMGSEETFAEALRELLRFGEVATRMPGVDFAALERALMATTRDDTSLADKLVNIISRGVKGEAGVQSKPMFENILRSLLVNESVYMPLLHAMIPAEVAGNMFFSEVWVDPDAEEGYEGKSYRRTIKVLIKFDIQSLGYFELVLLHAGGEVDIQLFTPPHMIAFKKEINAAIGEIAARNELNLHSLVQETAVAPKSISEVFPKLYERKNAINVVV